jgi:uncharacterized membrane protein
MSGTPRARRISRLLRYAKAFCDRAKTLLTALCASGREWERRMGEAEKSYGLVGGTVTIARPREELYEFWREFSNLGKFLHNVRSVHSDDPVRAHWVLGTAEARSVELDTIVIEDVPNEMIAWRAAQGSQIAHEGRVEFRDVRGGRGTKVTAVILYDHPATAPGSPLAQEFHHQARTQARRELRRFKQLMESGEISAAVSNRHSNSNSNRHTATTAME